MSVLPPPIIADRAEFIDVLGLLRRGHLLVQSGDGAGSCAVSGAPVYHSVPTLLQYGLLDPVPLADRPSSTRCWKLSPRGRHFAERACQEWRRKPMLERLAVRLVG